MTTPTVIHFDGGVRPTNSGPAAIGHIVETHNLTEKESEHLGNATKSECMAASIEYKIWE